MHDLPKDTDTQALSTKNYQKVNEMDDLEKLRIERLNALCLKVGGKAACGRLLGYADGAFVGHMLRGIRPITEKTINKIHSMGGEFEHWFDRENAFDATSLTETISLVGPKVVPKKSSSVFEDFFDEDDVARFKRLSKSSKHTVAAAALKAMEEAESREVRVRNGEPFQSTEKRRL